MDRFFWIVPLGFEQEFLNEINELLIRTSELSVKKIKILEVEMGGIECECEWAVALWLQRNTKLATRLLYRIFSFYSKEFWQFEKGINNTEIKNKIFKNFKPNYTKKINYSFEIAASKSKLNNEKRLKEILLREWTPVNNWNYVSNPPNNEFYFHFYFRNFQDQVTISLDLTLDPPLYHRGICEFNSLAPVRETIAAICIRQMISNETLNNLKNVTLLDPMCGRGTFLFEAEQIFNENKYRSYLIELAISDIISKELKQIQNMVQSFYQITADNIGFKKLIGQDISEDSLQAAEKNIENWKLKFDTESKITIQNKPNDFFLQADPIKVIPNLWIVMNPPYGERLKLGFTALDLLKAGFINYKCEKLGILWSKRNLIHLKKEIELWNQNFQVESNIYVQLESELYFKNGGLDVGFFVINKKPTSIKH